MACASASGTTTRAAYFWGYVVGGAAQGSVLGRLVGVLSKPKVGEGKVEVVRARPEQNVFGLEGARRRERA